MGYIGNDRVQTNMLTSDMAAWEVGTLGKDYKPPPWNLSGSSLPLIFCIHVRSGPIYWGVYLLAKKIIRWWCFTCKKHENIICDGILHVNMFHYFKIPYFTCNFFIEFTYNEYIGPYFLSHVVL
jgi:hypothetical protein